MKSLNVLFIFFTFLITHNTTHAQSKEILSNKRLFERGNYEELEKQLNFQIQHSLPKFSKSHQIQIYTDLGKVYIILNRKEEALKNLILAKQLNSGDSSKYGVYFSAYADLFNNIGAYDIALIYYKKSYNRTHSNLEKYFNLGCIGATFLKLNAPDSALIYFKKQFDISEKMADYIATSSSLNNTGIAYLKKKKYKEATKSFEAAIDIMLKNKASKSPYFQNEKYSFTNDLIGNIGRSYFEQGQYEKSISFLEQYHMYNVNHGILTEKATSEELLVNAYLKKGDLGSAKRIAQYFILKQNLLSTTAKIDLLFMQLEIANYEKNNEKITAITNQIKEFQEITTTENSIAFNEMNKLVSHFMLSQATQQIKYDKRKKLQLQKLIKIGQRESTLVWLLLFAVVFILLALVYFLNQRNKNKKKKDQLEKEYLILEEEKLKFKITTQEDYLTKFAIENNHQKKETNKLLKNLNHLIDLDEEPLKDEIKNLIIDLKNKQLSEKSIEVLNDKSEQLLLAFKTDLLYKHPSLTSVDIELCSLIKLNLSNKEIALYKNITNESVKIYKNRLKKKLFLENHQNLNNYISSI